MLNIPLKIIGILSVIFGLYLNYSAKHISNLFENVSENRLIQDGIYGYVRNPVYSAAFFCKYWNCQHDKQTYSFSSCWHNLLELYVTIIGCHGRKMAKRFVWKAI